MIKNKILFVGPFPPPYGGIAILVKLLYNSKLNDSFNLIQLNLNEGVVGKTEIISEKTKINYRKFLYGFLRLFKTMRVECPDLVYIQMNGGYSCFREALYMMFIRVFFKYKVVLHFHAILKPYRRNFPFIEDQKDRYINKLLINFCLGLSHKIIFLSQNIMNDFMTSLTTTNKTKSTYIDNFINIEDFEYDEKNFNNDKEIIFLFIGRLSKAKGFFDIIEIVDDIVSEFENVRFHFCGAPEREEALDEIRPLLNKLTDKGFIKLHGLVAGETKKKIFSESHIMLFPTYNEAFPNTILEGLAQGLPIITTPVGVIPHVIKDGVNGFIISAGDKEALKDKIIYLINHPEEMSKISKRNRKKAVERYDISIAVNKLKSIFEEQLQN